MHLWYERWLTDLYALMVLDTSSRPGSRTQSSSHQMGGSREVSKCRSRL